MQWRELSTHFADRAGAFGALASNVNDDVGSTTPNLVVSGLGNGAEGRDVCVFSLSQTDIVVDLDGVFTGGDVYQPVAPQRLLDTRQFLLT